MITRERLAEILAIEGIDTSDIPEAPDEWFERARLVDYGKRVLQRAGCAAAEATKSEKPRETSTKGNESMTVVEIMDEIDKATAPGVLTKQEALEFLEEISSELDGRSDALRGEIEAETKLGLPAEPGTAP